MARAPVSWSSNSTRKYVRSGPILVVRPCASLGAGPPLRIRPISGNFAWRSVSPLIGIEITSLAPEGRLDSPQFVASCRQRAQVWIIGDHLEVVGQVFLVGDLDRCLAHMASGLASTQTLDAPVDLARPTFDRVTHHHDWRPALGTSPAPRLAPEAAHQNGIGPSLPS